eukprot:6235924-Pyramimonas_sp.AAC.1
MKCDCKKFRDRGPPGPAMGAPQTWQGQACAPMRSAGGAEVAQSARRWRRCTAARQRRGCARRSPPGLS